MTGGPAVSARKQQARTARSDSRVAGSGLAFYAGFGDIP